MPGARPYLGQCHRVHSWIAVAAPGLEPILARELEGLGVQGQLSPGAITLSASLADGARPAREARTPTRFLLPVSEGPATPTRQLGDLVRRSHAAADWGRLALDAGGERLHQRGWRTILLSPSPSLDRRVDSRAARLISCLHSGKRVGIWVIQA